MGKGVSDVISQRDVLHDTVSTFAPNLRNAMSKKNEVPSHITGGTQKTGMLGFSL